MKQPNETLGGAFVALITPASNLLVVRSARTNSELELPGGEVEEDKGEGLWDAAVRETAEEAGIEVRAKDIVGRARLYSRISHLTTGLFVVKLSLAGYQAVDKTFVSDETRGLVDMNLVGFAHLPTHDELVAEQDDSEQECTFRAQRLFAQIAIGIMDRSLPQLVEDYLSGPFESEYLQRTQGSYYEAAVATH